MKPNTCKTHPFSSRICQLGTKCCDVQHEMKNTSDSEYRPKPLSKNERISLIEEVIARYKELSRLSDALHDLFGATADSKGVNPVWVTHDSYSKAVSRLIGDDFDWIGWFVYENNCGGKGMTAKASTWKKSRTIKTVKDLEKIISADYQN